MAVDFDIAPLAGAPQRELPERIDMPHCLHTAAMSSSMVLTSAAYFPSDNRSSAETRWINHSATSPVLREAPPSVAIRFRSMIPTCLTCQERKTSPIASSRSKFQRTGDSGGGSAPRVYGDVFTTHRQPCRVDFAPGANFKDVDGRFRPDMGLKRLP